jgi:hypothetical protein
MLKYIFSVKIIFILLILLIMSFYFIESIQNKKIQQLDFILGNTILKSNNSNLLKQKTVFFIYNGSNKDNSDLIQYYIDSIFKNGGGALYFPEGRYICSHSIILRKNVNLIGAGRLSSIIEFTNINDGFTTISKVNTASAMNTSIRTLSIVNSNKNCTGNGYVDICGCYIDLYDVYFSGWKNGIIFDQTELGTIDLCEFENQTMSSVWIVNGNEHTLGAAQGFTNRLSITRSQFNETYAKYNIIDDGGYVHTIESNNFNAGKTCIRIAGTKNLSFENNEIENHTLDAVAFFDTNIAGIFVGRSQIVKISNNMFADKGVSHEISIDFVDNLNISYNEFGRYVDSAIVLSDSKRINTCCCDISNNGKIVTGTDTRTAGPIFSWSSALKGNITYSQAAESYCLNNISSGSQVCIIPATMEGIVAGSILMIQYQGRSENIIVSSVNEKSFYANIQNSYPIYSVIMGMENLQLSH